jgi:hypothetical protein
MMPIFRSKVMKTLPSLYSGFKAWNPMGLSEATKKAPPLRYCLLLPRFVQIKGLLIFEMPNRGSWNECDDDLCFLIPFS